MRQFNAASCAWRALRRLILDPHLGKGPGISGKRSLQIKTHVAAIVARNTCNSSSSSSGGSSNNFRQPTTAFKCHSPKLQVKSALHERESTLKYYVPCSTLSCSHSGFWLRTLGFKRKRIQQTIGLNISFSNIKAYITHFVYKNHNTVLQDVIILVGSKNISCWIAKPSSLSTFHCRLYKLPKESRATEEDFPHHLLNKGCRVNWMNELPETKKSPEAHWSFQWLEFGFFFLMFEGGHPGGGTTVVVYLHKSLS